MKSDFELSFKMTEEEKERIKRILLENGGVRHYLLKLTDGTELDVVEYKKYQNLEIENQQKEFIEWLEKEIKETDKTIEMLYDTNSCRIPYLQNKNRLLKEILKKYKEIMEK